MASPQPLPGHNTILDSEHAQKNVENELQATEIDVVERDVHEVGGGCHLVMMLRLTNTALTMTHHHRFSGHCSMTLPLQVFVKSMKNCIASCASPMVRTLLTCHPHVVVLHSALLSPHTHSTTTTTNHPLYIP